MDSEIVEYEYAVAEVPAHIIGQRGGNGEAARLLKSIIDEHSREGFEFYRVDTFTTSRPAGCLGFGQAETVTYNLVTFRRPKKRIDSEGERRALLEEARRFGLSDVQEMDVRQLRREIARVRRNEGR